MGCGASKSNGGGATDATSAARVASAHPSAPQPKPQTSGLKPSADGANRPPSASSKDSQSKPVSANPATKAAREAAARAAALADAEAEAAAAALNETSAVPRKLPPPDLNPNRIPEARNSPLLDVLRGDTYSMKDAVKAALSSMPFPASAAGREVMVLISQAAGCLANADNLASLRTRAVAGLALLDTYTEFLANSAAQAQVAVAPGGTGAGAGFHQAVAAFRDILQGMIAFARPYCGRGCIVHMLGGADAASERATFERLCTDLTNLADKMMGSVKSVEAVEDVPKVISAKADDALVALRLGPSYHDHCAKLQSAVRDAGGLEAVCGKPGALLESALVIQELSLGSRVSKELAAALLAAHATRGPHRHIPQPHLRLLWAQAFPGEAAVPWSAFWRAFPAMLSQLPGCANSDVADQVGSLLASKPSRAAFQRHVSAANNVEPLLGEGADADAARLKDLAADVGSGSNGASVSSSGAASQGDASDATSVSAYALGVAFAAALSENSAAGFDDLAGDLGVILSASKAGALPHGPCQLPPQDPCYVGRDEDASEVQRLLGEGGKAVCITGASGMGKSGLALEVAWRLVRAGGAPAGALWVDVAGARSWHDVEARVVIAMGLIKDNTSCAGRIVSTLAGVCTPDSPLLLVLDHADDPLRTQAAATAIWELLGGLLERAPGVRLLLTSSAPITLSDGASCVNKEVGPMSPAAASKAVQAVAQDLSADAASRVALACRCLPLAMRLVCGLMADGRFTVKDVEALGSAAAARSSSASPLQPSTHHDITVSIVASVLTALPTHHQLALLQLSALPPAGASVEAALAVLGHGPGSAQLPANQTPRVLVASLSRQGLLWGLGVALPGRRPLVGMHDMLRGVVIAALAPALDLAVRPAAEERLAAHVLTCMQGWAKDYCSREGGTCALAAARGSQQEVAELMGLLCRVTPRMSNTGAAAASALGTAADDSAATAGQRLPLQAIVAVAKAFNGDFAELLHGLGALPAMEAVCEALSAPAVGLVANRSYKVEMANVYRIHALALTAQAKYEESQAHGNMCIHLRGDAAKSNPNSPAIASANMCLAASYYGMRYYENAEELLRQSVDICVAALPENNPHTAWATAALAACLEAQPTKQPEAEPLYRKALAARLASQGPRHPRAIEAQLSLASCLRAAGNHAEAAPLYHAAAVTALQVFGEYHAVTAAALSGVASSLDAMAAAASPPAKGADPAAGAAARERMHARAGALFLVLALATPDAASCEFGWGANLRMQGKHAEAEPHFRRALDLCGKCLTRDPQGREAPLTIAVTQALGRCLVATNKPGEAVAALKRALEAKVRLLGTQKHPEAAAMAKELAAASMGARRYMEAEPLCRQSLAMAQHGIGMESAEAAEALDTYARCLMALGRLPAAEPLFRQALDVRIKATGEGSKETAAARIALAECLAAHEDHLGAEEQYGEALDALKELPPNAAPAELAAAAHGRGAALVARGKHKEAEPLLKQALSMRQATLGNEHKDTAASLSALAASMGEQGRWADAEALFRAEVDAATKQQGADHPNTATALSALAACLASQNRHAEAEPIFAKAQLICTNKLGQDHPNTMTVTSNLAACLTSQGRHADAEVQYRRELEAAKRIQGEEHPDTAVAYNHMATCLQAQKKPVEAEVFAKQAVHVFRMSLGDEHPNTALACNTHGLVLMDAGRLQEAEELLKEALQVCTLKLGANHQWTANTKKNLEVCQAKIKG